jgi:hypothetical protein
MVVLLRVSLRRHLRLRLAEGRALTVDPASEYAYSDDRNTGIRTARAFVFIEDGGTSSHLH